MLNSMQTVPTCILHQVLSCGERWARLSALEEVGMVAALSQLHHNVQQTGSAQQAQQCHMSGQCLGVALSDKPVWLFVQSQCACSVIFYLWLMLVSMHKVTVSQNFHLLCCMLGTQVALQATCYVPTKSTDLSAPSLTAPMSFCSRAA